MTEAPMTGKRVLGIESSCDETAVAIVEDGKTILANGIASQVKAHERYGGVVPEIASRQHLLAIGPLVQRALASVSELSLADVDAVAVTQKPGLIGALVIGISSAKALAWSLGKPLLAVDHLEAHVYSPQLTEQAPPYPHVCLLVSGGHTSLYRAESPLSTKLLGTTRDDAAGEAFDKIAKVLGLGYPGGPRIAKLGDEGDPSRYEMPVPLLKSDHLDFSFSGLKTSAVRVLEREGDALHAADFAASVQEAIVQSLAQKLLRACQQEQVAHATLSGGVACNRRLRERATQLLADHGIVLTYPPPILCTDNAAMIAGLGYYHLAAGDTVGYDFDGVSSGLLRRQRRQKLGDARGL